MEKNCNYNFRWLQLLEIHRDFNASVATGPPFSQCSGVILIHSSSSLFHRLIMVVVFLIFNLCWQGFSRIFFIGFLIRPLCWPFHYFMMMMFCFKQLLYPFCSVHCLATKLQADWEVLEGKKIHVAEEGSWYRLI